MVLHQCQTLLLQVSAFISNNLQKVVPVSRLINRQLWHITSDAVKWGCALAIF